MKKKMVKTELHLAAEEGNEGRIRQLASGSFFFSSPLSVTQEDLNGWTPLHFASEKGFMSTCKLLTDLGASPNAKSISSVTPIHLAAKEGHTEVVKFLGQLGADANAKTNGLVTPMHFAAERGHAETCKVLHSFGASPNEVTNGGMTCLHKAAKKGHTETCIALGEIGADVNLKYKPSKFAAPEFSPIMYASENGFSETCEALVRYGANVREINEGGYNLIMLAAFNGHAQTCLTLSDLGANPNYQHPTSGLTALHIAAQKGYENVVLALFSLSVNDSLTLFDQIGSTALDLAKSSWSVKAKGIATNWYDMKLKVVMDTFDSIFLCVLKAEKVNEEEKEMKKEMEKVAKEEEEEERKNLGVKKNESEVKKQLSILFLRGLMKTVHNTDIFFSQEVITILYNE